MGIKTYSRHLFTVAMLGEGETILLNEREPFRFRDFSDNIQHVVHEGETLHQIAHKYYRGIMPTGMSAAQLFWVIADFQPVPILDPTVPPAPGSTLFVPSRRTVIEEIFNDTRRREANVV